MKSHMPKDCPTRSFDFDVTAERSRGSPVARRKDSTCLLSVLGIAFITFFAVVPASLADEQPQATATFQRLQQDLAADKKRGDWNAFLADAERQKVFLNGSPLSSLEIARAELELGHADAALVQIRRFLAMGQTNPILDSPLFRSHRAAIDEHLRNNALPVSAARPAFRLDDPGLLPEDIDYDPRTKRFFISSILKHSIMALDAHGQLQTFADSPEHWPMVAIKVDANRRRVWATEVAFDGFTAIASADWGRSMLLEYDLDSRALLSRYDGPPHSNLGDMALMPNGDPIVSDGTGGGVYRLQRGKLHRIDHGELLSPQTVAICNDGRHAFIPDYVRGIAAFDLKTGALRWLSTEDRYALDGIDGLYCEGRLLMAVQNGTAPERVVSFTLDASKSAINAESVVERATDTLGEPTHGVFVGRTFYFIANSGWNAIDEHGAETSGTGLTPALIMSFDVPATNAKPDAVKQ
jgi:sugar lactone lactonase YvrE